MVVVYPWDEWDGTTPAGGQSLYNLLIAGGQSLYNLLIAGGQSLYNLSLHIIIYDINNNYYVRISFSFRTLYVIDIA